MLNDGNDPHFALWPADVPSEDTAPRMARPVLLVAVLTLLASVGLIWAFV